MWSDFILEFGVFFAEVLSVIVLITMAVLFIFLSLAVPSKQWMDKSKLKI